MDVMEKRHQGNSEEILGCVLHNVQDPGMRSVISQVSRRWYDEDRFTRRHITVNFCYSTTPEKLYTRFPNLESLKLKGKPRVASLVTGNQNWGGYLTPWLVVLDHIRSLKSLNFRRMVVTDHDLKIIANLKGRNLESLKLDYCCGFSTHGLLHITTACSNLKTLSLEVSTVEDNSGEWFHQMAMNNSVLETLNLYVSELETIRVEDLEHLARNCPLVSVKIGKTNLSQLGNFFRSATSMQEFFGGSALEEFENYSSVVFPDSLTSLGFEYMGEAQLPILFPFSDRLRKLDLTFLSLTCRGYCEIISKCPNLEVLETATTIRDPCLEVVGSICKKLKRLRVDLGLNETGLGIGESSITHVGLSAVACGCKNLEYLAVYVSDIANEALEHIGTNLKHLHDFRLALDNKKCAGTDFPLDKGIRALLTGCKNLQRFALCIAPGFKHVVAVTDDGLGHIGEFGQNLRWMYLGSVGQSDYGLLRLSRGCPNLQKLELRNCYRFSKRALAQAATQLVSLRYMFVQGHELNNIVGLQEMARPCWNIEIFRGGVWFNANGDYDGEHLSHILAYFSLAGERVDRPPFIYTLETFPLPHPEAQHVDH